MDNIKKLTRRKFVKGSTLILGAPFLFNRCIQSTPSINGYFLSGKDNFDGTHFLSLFDANGKVHASIKVEQRVHGQAIHPQKRQVVFFARRPGTAAYVFNIENTEIEKTFESGPDRHFFGHGTFSKNGEYLFTCENNFTDGAGVIVVRETSNWTPISEFPSYGIGTHQIVLTNNGKRIIAANGGILTHPKFPRKKLNIDTMAPSLAYIDVESGKLLRSFTPQHHQLSIRHLSVGEDDTLGIAMQYQGNKRDVVPLIAFQKGDNELQYAKSSKEIWKSMKQYTASICMNSKQNIAAVTTSRGNAITFWNYKTGQFLHREKMRDVAGVSYSKEDARFVATTGTGTIVVFAKNSFFAKDATYFNILDTRWDNHMSFIWER